MHEMGGRSTATIAGVSNFRTAWEGLGRQLERAPLRTSAAAALWL